MNQTVRYCLALACATLASAAAVAQVYQWKDESGRTVISDSPPPGKYKAKREQSAAPVAASAPVAVTSAEKEIEFKKRQQDAKEKADREAKEKAAADARKQDCAQAQQALRVLESNERVATINEKGEREIYDAQRRKAETDRARAAVAEWCKP